MIVHHPTCNPNYPEKVVGEGPAEIREIELDDGWLHRFCVDCGASENVQRHAWDDLKEELRDAT